MIPFLWAHKSTVIPTIIATAIGLFVAFWPTPGQTAPAPAPRHMEWEINYNGQQYLLNEVYAAQNAVYRGNVAGVRVVLTCSQETPSLNVCGLVAK